MTEAKPDGAAAQKPHWVRKIWRSRLARVLAGTALTVAALWFLFDRVITNPDLALDYTKAALWPVVVVLTLYWLREPLGKKLGDLLKVNALGAEMEFDRRTDRLAAELTGPFGEVGATGTEGEEAPPEPAELAPDEAEGREVASEPEPADEGEGSAVAPNSSHETAPVSAAVFEDLLLVGRALGVSGYGRILEDFVKSPETTYDMVLRAIVRRAERLRTQHASANQTRKETRDGIEKIIRSSADWGYDMARSGAPKTVPDIVWSSDDKWRIVTEVARTPVPNPQDGGSLHLRSVKDLEDEIKKIEREKHSVFKAGSFDGSTGWLLELKKRLRSIDPGNPWAK